MAAESSDHNSDDEDEKYNFPCTTLFDFESEDSVPNIAVKTFLRDCYHQPKILNHKNFQFFRSYLSKLGLSFEMAPGAPFCEDHEETTFCVDLDDDWLDDLKERAESESSKNGEYWGSITPTQRKSDLGLIVFEWQPLPLTLVYLQAYIEFCESMCSKLNVVDYKENTDQYIKDFINVFKLTRNLEVEERYKGDLEAKRERKNSNKNEPGPSKDLDILLKMSPKRMATTVSSKPSKGNANGNNTGDNSSSSNSVGDSDSSSDSGGSEYKGRYTVRGQRKSRVRKKSVKKDIPNRTNGIIKNPTPASPANGVLNGKHPRSCKTDQNAKRPSRFYCEFCRNKNYATRKGLYRHLTRSHASRKRALVTCRCGRSVRKERLAFHQKYCSATANS